MAMTQYTNESVAKHKTGRDDLVPVPTVQSVQEQLASLTKTLYVTHEIVDRIEYRGEEEKVIYPDGVFGSLNELTTSILSLQGRLAYIADKVGHL